MTVNLDDLLAAASRYDDHNNAEKRADSDKVKLEQAELAARHRRFFLPAPERLRAIELSAATRGLGLEPAEVDTDEPDMPRHAILERPLIAEEVVLRDNDLRPIRFLQLALLAARAVGRIQISYSPVTEEGDATGFLVAPGLLMTNWHVLKTEDVAAAGCVIFDDEEELNGQPKQTKTFLLRPDQLFVNDQALDYAIVAVDSRTSSGVPLAQFGYFRLFEMTGKLDPTQRQLANIIQHPGGGRKKIAFRDNYIEPVLPDEADPEKALSSLYYGADTLRGSSGSPVCSDQWNVVALHRGGVPATKVIDGKRVVMRLDGTPAQEGDSPDKIRYEKNEGTRVSRIYYSLREKKSAGDRAAITALEWISAVSSDPRSGPINLPTTPILLPTLTLPQDGGAEEIVRRKNSAFKDATGYSSVFLGEFEIPLPRETSEVQHELAPLKNSDETELKYDHYSLKMNRERRTAFFVACNVDGPQLWSNHGMGALPDRPDWSYDPRMDESFQPDDAIFSPSLPRGHLFKREDAVWGSDEPAMRRSDRHSFTVTNATPMIYNFNNVEWGNLEDIVTRECAKGNKVSYFTGPIFRSTDPFYNELRRKVELSELHKGMRVPQSFWKIVAWVEDSKLKAAGFILHQTDEIEEHGPIPEINFDTYRPRPITEIEQATGLRFPELVLVDTYQS